MDDVIYQIGALPARVQAVVEAHGLLGASPRSWSSTT